MRNLLVECFNQTATLNSTSTISIRPPLWVVQVRERLRILSLTSQLFKHDSLNFVIYWISVHRKPPIHSKLSVRDTGGNLKSYSKSKVLA